MKQNIDSFTSKAELMDYIRDLPLDGSFTVSVEKSKPGKRTLTQNGCLHEYIADLAKALNDAGYDVKETITAPVDFTPETVKKYMFHPIMKALFPDKTSTKELSTVEISQVYENLNRLTSEKFGIGLLWPSRDNK